MTRASGSSEPQTITRPGAYGLHLPALEQAGNLLVQAPERWAEWQIVLAEGSGRPTEFVEEGRARLICEPSGWVDLERDARTSTIHVPDAPTVQEIAQPRLGITAIVAAHWRGEQSFHAGAFLAGGAAWGVLGGKGAGKSSLLATLAAMDVPVLADDLLVVDGRLAALAGPRCIDLREQAAAALGMGESIGVVGTRKRWRVRLGSVPCQAPLGGFVCLEWGEPEVRELSPDQRVRALFANLALLLGERRDATLLSALMELFALPTLSVRRPREIAQIDQTAERLLHAIGGLSKPPIQGHHRDRAAPP
jgi:hypothetical protein